MTCFIMVERTCDKWELSKTPWSCPANKHLEGLNGMTPVDSSQVKDCEKCKKKVYIVCREVRIYMHEEAIPVTLKN